MKITEIKADITKRLESLDQMVKTIHNYPPIEAVLNMDNQSCYELFGSGNSTLEEVETLCSMLVNGLYDDANIAFVKKDGEFLITWSQDDPKAIFEDELLEIVEAANKSYHYYEANAEAINEWNPISSSRDKDHPHNVWWALGEELNRVRSKYGWEPSDAVKANQIEIDEMVKKLSKKDE